MRSALKYTAKRVGGPEKMKDIALFVCGDFNALANEPVVQLLKKGSVPKDIWDAMFKKGQSPVCHVPLTSLLNEGDLPFTHKWGTKDDVSALLIDYIFYPHQHFAIDIIRNPCTQDQWHQLLDEGLGLPNMSHPSDHLPIACIFRRKEE